MYLCHFTRAVCAAFSLSLIHILLDDPKAVVLDIGGFTADYLLLKNGKADLASCDSLENGVILLYNKIRSRGNAELDLLLDEGDVDAILMGCLLYTSGSMPMLDGCLAAMKGLLSSTMGIQISGRRLKKNSYHPHHRQ